MPSLQLNCIVRNEEKIILKMLESVAPHITSWCIADTGSTDKTKEIIQTFFTEKKIPGVLVSCEFKNFSQARNVALNAGRRMPIPYDYQLLCDADMELVILDKTWADDLKGDAYDMFQKGGTLVYANRRFAKAGTTRGYVTPTHEYLDLDTGGCIDMAKAFFQDHANGSNRPEKYKRDIQLLREELKDNKKNVRAMYYLAQSYRDAGKFEKAAKWYKRRVEAGDWDEEKWSAQECYAFCLRDMGDTNGFVAETLKAYQMRPHRAETLHDLASYFRQKGDNHLAVLFAEPAMAIKKPGDMLFVNDLVYEVGCKDEFAISAFYVPEKHEAGFRMCNELSLKKGPYGQSREMARTNLFHYHPSLKSLCPSFEWKKIDFTPEDGWVALNPSVISHCGRLYSIIRTVNYKIDGQGRYLIRGTDGVCNNTNPINTRNFLTEITDDGKVLSSVEILPYGNLLPRPPAFPLVIGFEDMRLYSIGAQLFANACVRELTPEGRCEQVMLDVQPDGKVMTMLRLVHDPVAYEKNWMPIMDGTGRWMYKLDEVTDGRGSNLKHDLKVDIGAIGGGSQLIPFFSGWLCVVHEARQIPGAPTRFYSHRFAWLDEAFQLQAISLPFHLNEKGIEYVMGLATHPTIPGKLVLSYGFKDSEARIATIDSEDVRALIWRK